MAKKYIKAEIKKNGYVNAVELHGGTYCVGPRKDLLEYLEEKECQWNPDYEIGESHPSLVQLKESDIDFKNPEFEMIYEELIT